jgi:single-strand DNA-binding protein
MSLTVNRLIIAGNLTRDPEVKQLNAERAVANFTVAINNRYKGQDGELKSDPVFMNCEAWGKTAELVGQYLTKGNPVYCEGRLKQDAWTDADGKNRTAIKMLVERVQFLGARPPADQGDEGHGEPLPAPRAASQGTAPSATTTAPGTARPARPSRPIRQATTQPATDLGEDPPF